MAPSGSQGRAAVTCRGWLRVQSPGTHGGGGALLQCGSELLLSLSEPQVPPLKVGLGIPTAEMGREDLMSRCPQNSRPSAGNNNDNHDCY